jgi:hypothetical protein
VIKLQTDYDVGHEIIEKQYGAAVPQKRAPAAPNTINIDTIEVIERRRTFKYKGELYDVRHVDWWDGCCLEYHVDRIVDLFDKRVNQNALQELAVHYEESLALIWRNVRPRSVGLRIRRWIDPRWNPLDRVTNAEFSAIAHFCSECRTRLPDLALDISQGSQRGTYRRKITRTRTGSSFRNFRR